jgi:hypothetical protein
LNFTPENQQKLQDNQRNADNNQHNDKRLAAFFCTRTEKPRSGFTLTQNCGGAKRRKGHSSA